MSAKTSVAPLPATAQATPLLLWVYFPVVAVTLRDILPVTTVAVQYGREMRGCPDPAHLFIDVLAQVSHVEDTTPIVEVGIRQVFS